MTKEIRMPNDEGMRAGEPLGLGHLLFVILSTLGIGGSFDIAKHWWIIRHYAQRDAIGVTKPRSFSPTVLSLKRLLDVGHRSRGVDPAGGEVGEVELAVGALL